MIPQRPGLQRRLLLGFVGVAVLTAAVTSVATIAGFLVVANQHPIGANRIGRRLSAFLPTSLPTSTVAMVLVGVGAVLIAFAVLTAASIGERVLRPVGDLAAAADRMAVGDLAARVEPEGDDEIAEVGRSFNLMADNLQRSVLTLQHLEATARRFAADVSHELRTPLAAMTAVTDVLSEHAAGMNADAARATALVLQEITHLDRLVNDLIEISRFDSGTAVLDAELVDVRAAIETTLDMRRWREQVTVDAPEGLKAQLDLRRFDVILANLIGNAIKYGAPPRVVSAGQTGEELVVEVTDHGPGIATSALPHLFDRFYKADAARARSDGSGLGLAIARENARLHGGDIQAANRTSAGATFRLTLPLHAESASR